MFVIIAIYAVVLFVYAAFPKYLKVLVFVVNLVLPDLVPVVDEAFMLVMLLSEARS